VNSERRLHLAAHPVAYPLLRAVARAGPVVRVPKVGVVVNDATLAREVLLDPTFRKDGPGSPGDLWTPVLGPSVLLNMEGDAHRALRRKLGDLFLPGYADALCARILAGPLDELTATLRRGDTVDLAEAARVAAGAVIAQVIGLAATSAAEHRRLFHEGENIVAMIRLRTRRLSPGQVTRARAVLEPVGAAAARAYQAGDQATVMGRMRALGLSESEARGAAGAFFLTGTETVATLIPRLIALLFDTGTLGRVAAEESLLDTAIDEAMRVTTPTPVMLRSVSAPARIGRTRVRPGDRILIATHNCCRVYGPFRLDRPSPPELRRLWFGAGPHFCIGYPLASAEIRTVARAVFAAGPLRVVRRVPARRVLIPAYRRLEIAR
jgi:cytochrome P450